MEYSKAKFKSSGDRACPCWGVGYMDGVETLISYRNATKMFLPIFDLEEVFLTSKY
jgi:hypothetical protein